MKITNDIFIDGNLIKNSTIKIRYRGKFTVEFSNQVYVLYGYGLGWKNIQEQKMHWDGEYFSTEINLVDSGELNFCFKNDFGSWDNNNGNDYTVLIAPNKIVENEVTANNVEKKEVVNVENYQTPSNEIINNFQSKETKKNIDKNDLYKRVHVSEKIDTTRRNKIREKEESLFEYVNNQKRYNERFTNVDDILNGSEVRKTTTSKTNNSENKKTKKKKSKFKKFFRLILLLALIGCIIYYAINVSKIKNIQNENKGLLNVEINKESLRDGKNQVTERMLQVQKLNKEYPELKAWIEIEDTVINYPIMQRNDNSFYINHDYKKEYSKWGALFLDKDFDWSIPSSNLLIYGHNFSDGLMFADLLKYRDEEFYNNHKKIRFTTIEEDVEYDILAIFNSRVYYKSEQNVFRYYFFVDAETEEEFDEYVNNAKKASIYKTDIEAEYGDQLLTLSTCDYSQEDGRFVVVARKIND